MEKKNLKLYRLSVNNGSDNSNIVVIDLLSNEEIKAHRYYLYYDKHLMRINSIKNFLEGIGELEDDVKIVELDLSAEDDMLREFYNYMNSKKSVNFDNVIYIDSKDESEVLRRFFDNKKDKEGFATLFSPISEEDKEKVNHYFH